LDGRGRYAFFITRIYRRRLVIIGLAVRHRSIGVSRGGIQSAIDLREAPRGSGATINVVAHHVGR